MINPCGEIPLSRMLNFLDKLGLIEYPWRYETCTLTSTPLSVSQLPTLTTAKADKVFTLSGSATFSGICPIKAGMTNFLRKLNLAHDIGFTFTLPGLIVADPSSNTVITNVSYTGAATTSLTIGNLDK
jgi:hypothetical protein